MNPSEKPRLSELLASIAESSSSEVLTVGSIVASMGQRSYGGVIILLSVLGLLPGISIVAGAAIVLLAVQMILGLETPTLPGFVAKRQFNPNSVRQGIARPLTFLVWLESLVKPRLEFLTKSASLRALGFVIAVLALVMMTPFPLSNMLPAISLFLIALGLLEEDGLLVLVGVLSSVLSLALGVAAIRLGYELLLGFFGQV